MSDGPTQASAQPQRLIAAAFVLVLASIGTCAYCALAPSGERVGSIDLNASSPSLTFTLQTKSTLTFRLDATLPPPANEPSGRAARNAVYDTLGESELTLSDAHGGGAPRTVVCAAYDGRFVSANDTEREVAVHGIPLTCVLRDAPAGTHVLTATARWARGVRAHRADLEVRAEAR